MGLHLSEKQKAPSSWADTSDSPGWPQTSAIHLSLSLTQVKTMLRLQLPVTGCSYPTTHFPQLRINWVLQSSLTQSCSVLNRTEIWLELFVSWTGTRNQKACVQENCSSSACSQQYWLILRATSSPLELSKSMLLQPRKNMGGGMACETQPPK